jgi:hypothetical protein
MSRNPNSQMQLYILDQKIKKTQNPKWILKSHDSQTMQILILD